MNIEDTLRDFIVKELGWQGDREQLTPDYDLLQNDVIDSLAIFELVSLIEERLGVEIADDDLVPENFTTIASMTRMVTARQ